MEKFWPNLIDWWHYFSDLWTFWEVKSITWDGIGGVILVYVFLKFVIWLLRLSGIKSSRPDRPEIYVDHKKYVGTKIFPLFAVIIESIPTMIGITPEYMRYCSSSDAGKKFLTVTALAFTTFFFDDYSAYFYF